MDDLGEASEDRPTFYRRTDMDICTTAIDRPCIHNRYYTAESTFPRRLQTQPEQDSYTKMIKDTIMKTINKICPTIECGGKKKAKWPTEECPKLPPRLLPGNDKSKQGVPPELALCRPKSADAEAGAAPASKCFKNLSDEEKQALICRKPCDKGPAKAVDCPKGCEPAGSAEKKC